MKKYKITIEYDGTKYKGWQRLKNTDKTIQEKIEQVLSKVIGHNIEIHGSGRTDSGVHAYGQVAHFEAKESLELDKLLFTCNQMLPQDIVFKKIENVDETFHARFSVQSKRYTYKIWNNEIPSALNRKYAYHVPQKLDLEKMKKAASFLIGKHDFSSFSAEKAKGKSMVREIYSIDITAINSEVSMDFFGEGFLYKMVRIITGTLIEVGLGQRNPDEIKEILLKKDRSNAGETVSSHGLYLMEVNY